MDALGRMSSDLASGEARAAVRRRLRRQARACRLPGSPLYAGLLERSAADAEDGGPAWTVLAGHETDPPGSALTLRLMGAVHRLVLQGRALPRPSTTADGIAGALREEIHLGALVPGEPIRQEEVTARFGVSRIPVREAFGRLEAEGLVVVRPNRDAFVAVLTAEELREVYELRPWSRGTCSPER